MTEVQADPGSILVRDLYAGYDPDLDILRGVTISANAGEFVCLLGPNGAGKSTLLKSIFGLVRVRQGEVLINGRDLTGARAYTLARRGIGYVPQLSNVFQRLSVHENLEVGYAAHAGAGRPVRQRLETVYGQFPKLAERRRQDAGSLSGGERQLLALARALMPEPTVLLLDEPSAGLSPKAVGEVFSHIQGINRAGVTVLIVEQNARLALSIATRGYVLESGRNRHDGRSQDLLADERVAAAYLGAPTRSET